jgi:hypothetical protein
LVFVAQAEVAGSAVVWLSGRAIHAGQVIRRVTAAAGKKVSLTQHLTPGEYFFRFEALSAEPIGYTLQGTVLSDPIGPQPSDPTESPSSGNSPYTTSSSGNTYPSDGSSSSTSSSYNSDGSTSKPPSYSYRSFAATKMINVSCVLFAQTFARGAQMCQTKNPRMYDSGYSYDDYYYYSDQSSDPYQGY